MKRAWLLFALALFLSARWVHTEADAYDVYAVRFATIADFPVSSLVAGADRARRFRLSPRTVFPPVRREGLHLAVGGDRAARPQSRRRDRHLPVAHALG